MSRVQLPGLLAAMAVLAAPGAALAAANPYGVDGWNVSFTPYLWLAGASGNVGMVADLPPVPVEADFPSVFDHLTGAFMGAGEIRYGAFGLLVDYDHIALDGDHSVHSPGGLVTVSGKIKTTSNTATVAAFYRFYASEKYSADVVAGARYVEEKLSLDVSINNLHASGSRSFDEWVPVIGARGSMRTGKRGSLSLYGDIDPFDGGDIPAWQVYGAYNYQFMDNVAGSIGYRWYGLQGSRGTNNYDLTISGPILAVTFGF